MEFDNDGVVVRDFFMREGDPLMVGHGLRGARVKEGDVNSRGSWVINGCGFVRLMVGRCACDVTIIQDLY